MAIGIFSAKPQGREGAGSPTRLPAGINPLSPRAFGCGWGDAVGGDTLDLIMHVRGGSRALGIAWLAGERDYALPAAEEHVPTTGANVTAPGQLTTKSRRRLACNRLDDYKGTFFSKIH